MIGGSIIPMGLLLFLRRLAARDLGRYPILTAAYCTSLMIFIPIVFSLLSAREIVE